MLLKSLISVLRFLFNFSMDSFKLTSSKTFHIYYSLYLLKGSKLFLILPENRKGC